MSNTNPPELPGDSGDTAWQEYLTGGGQAASASGGAAQPDEPGAPHRVIGTPAPATARTMLSSSAGLGASAPRPARELPPGPEDLIKAKKAERIVAACFILAMLAGFGFLVAYGLIGLGSITAVQHSNLVLGLTLSLSMLLLGAGATIWVRHLMPQVELT